MTGEAGRAPRLAAHTYAYRDLTLEAALARIAALEFEAVEVWLGHAAGGAGRAAAAVRDSGLRPVAVGAGGFYDERAASFAPAVELARALDVQTLVGCVSRRALASLSARQPPGLVLCVENHWDQEARSPDDVLRLLDAAPGGPFRSCLDTGHALLAGLAPERFAETLGATLAHVHLKDARRASLLERALGTRMRRRFLPRPGAPPPGTGALDVGALLRALERIDYRGWITVEDEGTEVDSALSTLRASALNDPAPNAAERQI